MIIFKADSLPSGQVRDLAWCPWVENFVLTGASDVLVGWAETGLTMRQCGGFDDQKIAPVGLAYRLTPTYTRTVWIAVNFAIFSPCMMPVASLRRR
ncbi:MAG: hypothetical protein WA771_05290, partial [Chthoniobacterales bacterium]